MDDTLERLERSHNVELQGTSMVWMNAPMEFLISFREMRVVDGPHGTILPGADSTEDRKGRKES